MIQPSATRLRQLWLAAFVLGSALINFPFISIFDRNVLVFGFPLLYAYFFLGWFSAICVIYVYCRLIKNQNIPEDAG
jgi:hypothetical protein